MGIDGIFLYELKKEIAAGCQNARVDKIYQPSKEELVLLLRTFGPAKKLLICARPSSPRIHFTTASYENPAEPPMFCMLMRKYLSGARFSHIENTGFERTAVLVFDSVNELGDHIAVSLAVEMIGKQTNVILIGNDGRIIDAVKRSDMESTGRLIQPGARYTPPKAAEKKNIAADEITDDVFASGLSIASALVAAADGVSPLTARETAVRAGIDIDKPAADLTADEKQRLASAIDRLRTDIAHPAPYVVLDENGAPLEFSYLNITQYGEKYKNRRFDSFSELLEFVYAERDAGERRKALSARLAKLLSNLRARAEKKIAVRKKEQVRCAEGEKYRIYGELLKANLYAVERGAPYADVQNYYDPELKTVRIPLNTTLSPAQNAQKYFKEYKKCCNASAMLDGLIAESEAELAYLESVIDELNRADTAAGINEIKQELAAAGYLRLPSSERKKQTKPSAPIETVSPDGYRVLIGRNNRQNDELTLKTADGGDMWFHTKNIPGSHVIVVCGGEELPESTVLFAASLAAAHSKAAGSSSVPVDYTRVKFIKKPAGARPGMVIYKTNKTVYVTPKEEKP